MTDIENAILRALNQLASAVEGMATAQPKPDLRPIFEELDALARQLPRGANPELAHFLDRKSYEKARLLLQGSGPGIARGSCR